MNLPLFALWRYPDVCFLCSSLVSFFWNTLQNVWSQKAENALYFLCIGFLFGWFFFSGLFFVFAIKEGVAPDENYHLSLIYRIFDSHFSVPLIDEGLSLGLTDFLPLLYHRTVALLLPLNIFPVSDLIFLRLLNLFVSMGTILFSFFTLRLISNKKVVHVMGLVIMVALLPFVFLSTAVGYDPPTNFFAVGSLFLLFRLHQKFSPLFLLWLFVFLSLGALVKITFLPYAFFVFLWILFIFWRHRTQMGMFRKAFFQNRRFFSIMFSAICIFVGANVYWYGGNLIRFHHLQPRCEQVFSEEKCSKNIFAARDMLFKKTRADRPLEYSFLQYAPVWISFMEKRITGLVTFQKICGGEFERSACEPVSRNVFWTEQHFFPPLAFSLLFFGFFLFALFSAVLYGITLIFPKRLSIFLKGESVSSLVIFCGLLFLCYVAILIIVNYQGYTQLRVLEVGLHGRYLYPVFLPLIAFSVFFFFRLLPPLVSGMCVVLFLPIFLCAGLPLFLSTSESKFLLNTTYGQTVLPPPLCPKSTPNCQFDPQFFQYCQSERTWQCWEEKRRGVLFPHLFLSSS